MSPYPSPIHICSLHNLITITLEPLFFRFRDLYYVNHDYYNTLSFFKFQAVISGNLKETKKVFQNKLLF